MWRRRERWYDECSTYLLPVRPGDTNLAALCSDLVRLVQHATASAPAAARWVPLAGLVPALAQPQFFLSLTDADVADAVPVLPVMSEGVDALELRVDLLRQWDPAFVADQVALLRRQSALPLVFTVRSQSQGGKFPDDDEAALFSRTQSPLPASPLAAAAVIALVLTLTHPDSGRVTPAVVLNRRSAAPRRPHGL